MRNRHISEKIVAFAKQFPVITITGPRQSGKTTLAKMLFPHKAYVSLEDLDERYFAQEDPRGFLDKYEDGAIIDEIQHVPDLLSYIQTRSDKKNTEGLYILTGSHQLEIHSRIAQSLAGRTAIVTLLPFSLYEAYDSPKDIDLDTILYSGFYPRIFDKGIDPTDMMRFYTNTYLEKDIRQLINLKDFSKFNTFLKLCAGRTGQVLNLSQFANDCDVNQNTIKHWLSILEASYIITQIQPYYRNINKRLTKSPKLYFLDTGLACFLMGVHTPDQLRIHPLRGAIFETFIVNELIKTKYNASKKHHYYFYRDYQHHEIDLIHDDGSHIELIEIKSSKTPKPDDTKQFNVFPLESSRKVIYAGDTRQQLHGTQFIPWFELK